MIPFATLASAPLRLRPIPPLSFLPGVFLTPALLTLSVICFFALSPKLFAGEADSAKKDEPVIGILGEFEGQNVQEIDVRGCLRVSELQVLKMIRTRKGRPFEQKVWEEDWHRLDDSNYFLNVRITEPIKWAGGLKLTIDLVEKATIAKIEYKGSKAASSGKLKSVIRSVEGGRYDKGQVFQDSRAIERHFQDAGYRTVKVDYAVEPLATHRQNIGGKEVEVDDEVKITFSVEEGSSVSVRKLTFTGNTSFSDTELQGVMQTKYRRFLRPGDLKDDDLETDKKRLESFYLRHGYMDVQIQEVKIDTGKGSAFNWFRKRKVLADVCINIVEGPQYFTGEVKITGNTNKGASLEELQTVMKIKPGHVFSDTLCFDDKQKMLDLYGERGRPFTKIDFDRKLVTDPDRAKRSPNIYDVSFVIREGSEISVGQIIVRGNTKTKEKIIIRQLELYPGQRVDTTKLKYAIERLKRLNYFENDIRITPEPTDNPEEANVIVDVTEKGTGELNFGVGVSSVDSVVGNFRMTQRNFDWKDMPKSWRDLFGGNAFIGAGQTASLDATAGLKRQNYVLSFFEPWAFDRPIRAGGSIFHTVDNYTDFKDTSTGFSITAGRRLWSPRWDGDVTYRFSYTDISQTNNNFPPILQRQIGSNVINSIKPRIVYDSRDSLLLPSKGWLFEASIDVGAGTYDYFRPSVDLAHYTTVYKLKSGGKHILSMHAHAESVDAFGSSNDVPPFLRLYGGGIDTVRGFAYRSITPYEKGFQIGGKRLAYATAEYSMPLYEEVVRGLAFVDSGSVWDAGKTDPHTRVVNTSGRRTSIGLGLAVRTPFSPAPVRIYISRAVEHTPFDRLKRIDFTLGTRF